MQMIHMALRQSDIIELIIILAEICVYSVGN